MGEELNSSYTDLDILLYGERLNTIVVDTDIELPSESKVKLNDAAKSNYEYWSCSDSGDMCNGLTLVSSEVCWSYIFPVS